MRLVYLAAGKRDYAASPVRPYRRGVWEFQAVVAGRLGPTRLDRAEPLASRRLWVFPPDDVHGWTGDAGRPCRVVVFHVARVPGALREAVEGAGHSWSAALDPVAPRRLELLAEQLAPHYDRPTSHSAIHVEHAALELSMLALRDVLPTPLSERSLYAKHKTEQATHWFAEHLGQGVSLDDVARAVHVSPPHLRRLFRQAGSESPRAVFQRLRIERAEQLLAATGMTLHEVADAVGFSGPTVLCRSFKQVTGLSPGASRRL